MILVRIQILKKIKKILFHLFLFLSFFYFLKKKTTKISLFESISHKFKTKQKSTFKNIIFLHNLEIIHSCGFFLTIFQCYSD
jgi:hypothetical protein